MYQINNKKRIKHKKYEQFLVVFFFFACTVNVVTLLRITVVTCSFSFTIINSWVNMLSLLKFNNSLPQTHYIFVTWKHQNSHTVLFSFIVISINQFICWSLRGTAIYIVTFMCGVNGTEWGKWEGGISWLSLRLRRCDTLHGFLNNIFIRSFQ